jgi:hypothetical protein
VRVIADNADFLVGKHVAEITFRPLKQMRAQRVTAIV